jgi:hypothetical protein
MVVQIRALAYAGMAAVLLAGAVPALAAGGGNTRQCRKGCSTSTADTTAPTVAFSTPGSGTTVAGSVTLSGTAGDNVALAAVDTSVDGGPWTRASGTTSWSRALDTTSYGNGSHTLAARATDTSGNTRTTSIAVTVANPVPDTSAPVVVIAAPSSGTTVSGTVAVSGSAGDNVALARVETSVDGGSWQTASGTSAWSWTWNTASLPDGTHTVSARSTDSSGNASTSSVTVTVSNSTPSSPPPSSPAPNTQGSWTSPEGVRINVNSAGPWTISQVYSILTANALDLDRLGPTLTVNVQDTISSSTTTSATLSGGRYTNWTGTIYLKGINSSFANGPDDITAHEYGHAWASYWRYTAQGGSWAAYQSARWTAADGSTTLANDARTNSSYTWQTDEILADDYRILFGTAAAISQRAHMNSSIPDPRVVDGLRATLLGAWRGQ